MTQSDHPPSLRLLPARVGVALFVVSASVLSIMPMIAAAAPAADPTTTTIAPVSSPSTTTTTTSTTTSTTTTTTTSTTTTSTTVPPAVAPPAPVATAPIPVTTAAAAPQNLTIYPEQIGNVLATIRYLESRGQYQLPPNKGNASGAYQFIASTWDNYGGYPHAYLAPNHIQDERAAQDVTKFLSQWNNDVSMIPVMWYYPKASREPALMDIVPVPSAGNVLTIREYQQRWLAVFATISGEPVPQPFTLADAVAQLGLPPTPAQRKDGLPSVAFPVLGPSRIAAPDCDNAPTSTAVDPDQISRADIEAAGLCTEQAPSIVFGVKLQPVLAAADGVVTHVDMHPAPGKPVTVTITAINGRSYVYAGFNDDNPGTDDGAAPAYLRLTALAVVGQTVWAGQVIGFMGDTDPLPLGVRADVPTDATVVIDPNAVAPHLRLTIIDLDGSPVDAFGPVVDALFATSCRIGIGPWSVPANGVAQKRVVIETTDNNSDIDSEWVITATGQVTATGWAAMINPSKFCTFVPVKAFGPGADGSKDIPGHWWFGLDLPTDIWLDLALADSSTTAPFLRF